jgi:hypothetical protein
VVNDERGDILADHQQILTRWKNYFCQLLNIQGPGCIRQTEIHTAEQFVSEPRAAEVQVAIRKMKSNKAPGSDQFPAELIQARGETLRSEIHKLTMLTWNKEELPHQWKGSIVVPIQKRVIKLTAVIIEAYHCCQLHTKFYLTFFSLG